METSPPLDAPQQTAQIVLTLRLACKIALHPVFIAGPALADISGGDKVKKRAQCSGGIAQKRDVSRMRTGEAGWINVDADQLAGK